MYFVIPCFNEEESIEDTALKLSELTDAKILFVNDCSTDNTKKILQKICSKNNYIEFINTEKNVGQQKAILHGLSYVYNKCDFAITLDCDLQDDISAISEMIKEYYDGAEVVYGVRKNRNTDSTAKRITAEFYYFILKMLDKTTIKNHGDFRLMNNNAIGDTLKYSGKYPYLRGLIPKLGFKGKIIYYNRQSRKKGKSKYTILKMMKLSFCGIYTAFFNHD